MLNFFSKLHYRKKRNCHLKHLPDLPVSPAIAVCVTVSYFGIKLTAFILIPLGSVPGVFLCSFCVYKFI